MLDVLRTAIASRRVIYLSYDPGGRTIEPHALGRGGEGQLLLRAYQTDGASSSGDPRNWKLFRLDEARDASLTEETFTGPRPGYRRGDKAMKGGIIAEL